jgi:uncharacterized protein
MLPNTPGVYFEQADRGRPGIGALRTDIPAFMGYCERGPLLTPVKITGWRQFGAVFGQVMENTHLGYAVRGFFQNQGAALYVVRVADPDVARPAHADLLDGLEQPCVRLWASHGELRDPVTDAPRVDGGVPLRFSSPGAWGNRLSVSVLPASRGTTTTVDAPAPGRASSLVRSLSGFEPGSLVRLSQGSGTAAHLVQVQSIDAVRKMIEWTAPLEGLGLDTSGGQPLRLETVELTLLVHLDGQVVERHTALSLEREHSRYIETIIRKHSRYIDAQLAGLEGGQIHLPERWPASIDRTPLTGGQDGLASVDRFDYLTALDQVRGVQEISLLAAPDLVLVTRRPDEEKRFFLPLEPCDTLEPLPKGKLRGRVVMQDGTGSPQPLAGVRVRVLGSSQEALTGSETPAGEFSFDGLPVGRVSLLLERAGFYPLEATAQTRTVLAAEANTFTLTPITLPPTLSDEDIWEVQSALLDEQRAGRYRVVILDPPYTMQGFDEIQTWRARFDASNAALYTPWVVVDREDGRGVREAPPSGHVAGAIARIDLAEGVHRAPANLTLDGVKALVEEIDDARQGILNPQGVNCLRSLPGRGLRIWGARTLSSDPEWRYLNVRRLLYMIEAAVEASSQWAVFEPNNHILRQALSFSLSSFLNELWRLGALAGSTPEAAYQVQCDVHNNPPGVVDAGQLVAEIAVSPAIPFEFIRFRLGRTEEAIQITE